MGKVYYIDGEFVNADEAKISATDLAIVRGYGVFDYFRTYGSLPIEMERNIQRLRNSAAVIGMELPWTDSQIESIVLQTIQRNGYDESSVRIIVTGGDADDFFTPIEDAPRLLVYVEPIKPPPSSWYSEGVTIATVRDKRQFPQSKSLNYIPAILAMKQAREIGAIEAVYVDECGNVLEGTTTNIFAFFGDEVVTPKVDILPGVTRARVIEILSNDYTVIQRDLPYEELLRADDVVITAANKQIVPVVQIDDKRVNDTPGKHSRALMQAFQDYTESFVARRFCQN